MYFGILPLEPHSNGSTFAKVHVVSSYLLVPTPFVLFYVHNDVKIPLHPEMGLISRFGSC